MRVAAKIVEPGNRSEQRSRHEDNLAHCVYQVLLSLEQAARGEDTAWTLSNAMEVIDTRSRNETGGIISLRQRDKLLGAVVRAQLGATQYLPKSYRREQIYAGMEALAGQVMIWAETREETLRRSPHAVSDLRAYARMFRNDLHNMSLLDEIKSRAWQR